MKAIESSLLGDPIVVPHETTLELYRKMLTVFFVEERMKIFVKQGKCSFNASTRGHEKVQIGMTMLLRPGFDWFFPYYRSKALAIGLGMPLKTTVVGPTYREMLHPELLPPAVRTAAFAGSANELDQRISREAKNPRPLCLRAVCSSSIRRQKYFCDESF